VVERSGFVEPLHLFGVESDLECLWG
jgi:hypothetical protein